MRKQIARDFKPKWIAWYETDFQAKVLRMTWLQRHFYRALCIQSYFNELRPYLPDDDNRLWELADCKDLRQWKQNKEKVLSKFERIEGEDGTMLLRNKRVLEEWDAMEANLAQKKNASAKGVAARKARAVEKSPQTPLPDKDLTLPAPDLTRTSPHPTYHPTLERSPDGDRTVNGDGWLVGCVCSLLQEQTDMVTVPNDEEIRELNALAAKYGDLAVLLAFSYFANRDKEFTGVAWPLKLFFKEAGVWMIHAVRQVDNDAPFADTMRWVWDIVAKPLREHFERVDLYPLGRLAEEAPTDAFVVDYLKNHRISQIIEDIDKITAMRNQETAKEAA